MLDHPNLTIMSGPKRATSSSTSTSTSTSPSAHHDSSNNALCSAYSTAAKATEDWTTIEDRTERRRIQNRIAQRAYRQKLKERLLHLERKAASSTTGSESSSQSHHGSPSPDLHHHSLHHHHVSHTSDADYSRQQPQWSQSPPTQFYAYDDVNADRYFGAMGAPGLDFDAASTSSSSVAYGQQAYGAAEPYYLNAHASNQGAYVADAWFDGSLALSSYPELDGFENSVDHLSYEHLLRQ